MRFDEALPMKDKQRTLPDGREGSGGMLSAAGLEISCPCSSSMVYLYLSIVVGTSRRGNNILVTGKMSDI